MTDRNLSLLGIAKKAGRVTHGMDAVIDAAEFGQARLILLADDISENSEERIRRRCANVGIIKTGFTSFELGGSIGRGKTAVVAVTDKGLAETLSARLDTSGEKG